MRLVLRSFITIILSWMIGSLSHQVYAQPLSETPNAPALENTDSVPALTARWVKRGVPLTEFPVCYQLWQCLRNDAETPSSVAIPEGTWGICENFLTAGTTQCGTCNVSSPTIPCQ